MEEGALCQMCYSGTVVLQSGMLVCEVCGGTVGVSNWQIILLITMIEWIGNVGSVSSLAKAGLSDRSVRLNARPSAPEFQRFKSYLNLIKCCRGLQKRCMSTKPVFPIRNILGKSLFN